ncbi:hypothetical protein [Sulfurimonas paralvinellae]|uniref:Uncharacterized protein n=1 Tax=Sulfurimonas paralvinellae TaxID=317658 RepID=A0A7M1B9Z9_9BACT|nr:hypothetical protein [Sulfurimonas paralvinellae]QOP46533.1 hypothetical protein FM071_09585 [Sulfurimonas paralvinellae]
MKKHLLLYTLAIFCVSALSAKEMPIQTRELPKEELQKQKVLIASLAAKELSKTLPQKIDNYTTLKSITNNNATLVYTFTINTGAKSDDAVIKEDHSRMQKVVTQGVCKSSERFLESGINTTYIYVSAKTDKTLFKFDITKEKCANLPMK